jgi:hypothetical protein
MVIYRDLSFNQPYYFMFIYGLIRLLYYLPMEMTKKEEKKSECKNCKALEKERDELQAIVNKRYYADLEREKAFRELNEKYVDKQREINELQMAIRRRENDIMFLC